MCMNTRHFKHVELYVCTYIKIAVNMQQRGQVCTCISIYMYKLQLLNRIIMLKRLGVNLYDHCSENGVIFQTQSNHLKICTN